MLAIGGVGLALQPTKMVQPAGPLQVFSPEQFSILFAVANRVHPGLNGLPTGADVYVAEGVDALLGAANPGIGQEIGLALQLLENGLSNFVFDGRPRNFSACLPATQDLILAGWRDSRVETRRTVYKGLLGLITATYWARPQLWKHVGYPGPPTPAGQALAKKMGAG